MHYECMRTHSDIARTISANGTAAQLLGVSRHTIRSWIQRGSIPADRWVQIVSLGWATLDELAQSAAARKAA